MTMAGCDELSEMLSAYADGHLPEEKRAELEEHLAGCAGCRSALEGIGEIDGAARDIPEPDASKWDGVWNRIAAETRRYEARRAVFARAWKSSAWVAAAAALLAAVYIFGPSEAPRHRMPMAGGFEVMKIEVDSPRITPVVMLGDHGQLPVVWLERT